MPESRRLESPTTPDADTDRLGQAEALLIDGLDRYFGGQYEEAIHVWTRVLFLDRSHARARAYIDRARTAIAERQRRSEEMLQTSHDLLERGQMAAARNLLTEAVAESGEDERASALRLKLERLERAYAGTSVAKPAVTVLPEVVRTWTPTRRSPVRANVFVMSLAAVLIAIVVTSPAARRWWSSRSSDDVLVVSRASAALPVLSSSDVALVRARTLYSRGRLAEALQALDRINVDSAARTEADGLRVEIQRLLLASGQDRPRQAPEVDPR